MYLIQTGCFTATHFSLKRALFLALSQYLNKATDYLLYYLSTAHTHLCHPLEMFDCLLGLRDNVGDLRVDKALVPSYS